MKVCFFDFTVNFGGGPQGSLFLMSRLQNKGIKCYVLDAFGVSNDYSLKAKKYSLDYRVLYKKSDNTTIGYKGKPLLRALGFITQSRSFINVTIRLLAQIEDIKPNIIIVNNEKSLFFAYLAKQLFDFKILLYFRGEGIKSQLRPRFIKALNKKSDHIVAHSKTAIENLREAGVCNYKLSYVPNCIEPIKHKCITDSFISEYDSFNIILTAARPVKEKGYDIAIEAVNKLIKEGYNINLFLPGVTPTGSDKSYENLLSLLIKKYNLEDYVHLIGWRDDLVSDIAASDLVILPSHTEGFPRSIIESMLVGTPVCATPVGGIPEAITHGKTGMLFQIDDIDGLSNCIKAYIEKPELYNSILDEAKSFSKAYFNHDHNTVGIIKILERIK